MGVKIRCLEGVVGVLAGALQSPASFGLVRAKRQRHQKVQLLPVSSS